MGRPYAAFDIDGTIIRWQLYHALGDELAKRGHIDNKAFDQVRQARMNWKRRTGQESFRDYEMALVDVFDKALQNLKVKDFEKAAETVFQQYKDQTYTYTRDLIKDLKTKGYLLFAISGSPSVIVQKFADYYGFDAFAATNYPTEKAHFIGTKDLSIGKKPELLQILIDKHGASQKDSVGVGDSEGDIAMLEMTALPIAFNPSKKLFQHASQHNWKIIVERKNMVYELEPRSGSYILAKTNA